MKRALFITAMCLAVIAAKAQNATGRIVNESLKPIAYVNVVLLSADSTYINGVTTADDGTFSISYDQDSCLLKVSCVGYETRFLAVKDERMGDIVICHDSHILKEVVVEAARPAMKMTPGGMSFDVQKSLLSQVGTALDVLSELPRVNVTSSGSVNVFGKGSPLIYINGRQLKSDTELRQLTSKDIKSVEVITAPGARYSAGVGSVINITTIKRLEDFMSFFVPVRGSYFKEHAEAGGVSATYRKKGFELNLYPYYNNDFSAEKTDFTSVLNMTDYKQKTVQHGEFGCRTQSFLPSASLSYDFSKDHSVGMSVSLNKTLKYDASMNSNYSVFRNDVQQAAVPGESDEPVCHQQNLVVLSARRCGICLRQRIAGAQVVHIGEYACVQELPQRNAHLQPLCERYLQRSARPLEHSHAEG